MEQKDLEQMYSEESLPLEILFHILSFLERDKDILSAKRVNRTWYELINGNTSLLRSFPEKYVQTLLQKHAPQFSGSLKDYDYTGLLTLANRVKSQTKHPVLKRAKISLVEQFTLQTILSTFKETLIQMLGRMVLGPLTPRNIFLTIAGVTLLQMHLFYFLKLAIFDSNAGYLETLIEAPYFLFNKKREARVFLLTAGILFCLKFWENISNSRNILEQRILNEMQRPIPPNVAATEQNTTRELTELITISWRREKLMGKVTSRVDDEDKAADPTFKPL